MKEAAGEANLTVIAIVLIGIVAAVATPLIKSLMDTTSKKSCCLEAGGTWQGNDCTGNSPYYDQSTYENCKGTTTKAAS